MPTGRHHDNQPGERRRGFPLVLLGLGLVALILFLSQQRSDNESAIFALKRAGARVRWIEEAPGPRVLEVDFSQAAVDRRKLTPLGRLDCPLHLDLSGTTVGDEELALLARCDRIGELNLRNTRVSDAGLESLATLNNLRILVLGACPISDAGLSSLAALPQLTSLDLTNTPITDEGLAQCRRLPRLEELVLAHTRITDAGLEAVDRLPRLARLDLTATSITDAGLAALRGCPTLRRLSLGHTQVTNAGLRHLDGATRLKALDLSHLPITNAGLSTLATLASLRELNLRQTRIDDPGLSHLLSLPLQKIVLSYTNVTDRGLETLARLDTLQHLELDGGPPVVPLGPNGRENLELLEKNPTATSPSVTNAGLEHVARLSELRVLTLSRAVVTDAGLAHLRNSSKLHRLDLSSTGISDAGLAHLTRLHSLRELDLGGTAVTGSGLAHLRGMLSLRTLSLGETALDDRGLEPLRELANLTHLTLSGTAITDASLATLSALPHLRDLALDRTGIGSPGLEHLQRLRQLARLSLSRTRVGDSGLEHLKQLDALEEITAYHTDVTPEAVEIFLDRTPPVRVLLAEDRPAPPPQPPLLDWEERLDPHRLDSVGDPVPQGARARLGTMRLTCPEEPHHLALGAEGNILLATGRGRGIWLFDGTDGRRLPAPRGAASPLRVPVSSPDGRRLACADERGVIRLYDIHRGQLLREFRGSWSQVLALAFTPDGASLLVADIPLVLHVLNLETGTSRVFHDANLRHHPERDGTEVYGSLAFAPDGRSLAVGSRRTTFTPAWRKVHRQQRLVQLAQEEGLVRVWTWPDKKPRGTVPCRAGWGDAFAFAQQGRSLVVWGRDNTLELREIATGTLIRRFPGVLAGNGPALLAVPPPGRTVLLLSQAKHRPADETQTVSNQVPLLESWDLETGQQIPLPALRASTFAVSPEGKILATGVDHGIDLRDRATAKERIAIDRHRAPGPGRSVLWTPEGKSLVTVGTEGSIRIWDRTTGRQQSRFTLADLDIETLGRSPDGAYLVVGGHRLARTDKDSPGAALQIHRRATGEKVYEAPLEDWADSRAITPQLGPDGLLVVGQNAPSRGRAGIVIQDLSSNEGLRRIPCESEVLKVTLSANGKFVAFAERTGLVRLAEVATGKVLRRVDAREGGDVVSLILSSEGRQLAIGRRKGRVLLSRTPDGPIDTIPYSDKIDLLDLLFDPRGRLLGVGTTNLPARTGWVSEMSVWDLGTGKTVRPNWKTTEVLDAVLSPEGTEVATLHPGGGILLWDAAPGEQVTPASGR